MDFVPNDLLRDQVRPFLAADGGDVEVVEVTKAGVVFVRLEGACGTCASSAMTMKLGIESALAQVMMHTGGGLMSPNVTNCCCGMPTQAFGSKLKELVQLDGPQGRDDGPLPTTVSAVNDRLHNLKIAIQGVGGR